MKIKGDGPPKLARAGVSLGWKTKIITGRTTNLVSLTRRTYQRLLQEICMDLFWRPRVGS